jgi:hypothetical protein
VLFGGTRRRRRLLCDPVNLHVLRLLAEHQSDHKFDEADRQKQVEERRAGLGCCGARRVL